MDLPPGFRFHPTDEEIISEYLTPKVINGRFSAAAIGEVDMNKCEPWDLPISIFPSKALWIEDLNILVCKKCFDIDKAKMGEKEWYFYCNRDRKYPTGMRTNRSTESGYWKATGKDKEIYKAGRSQSLIGMKKTLVFYKGRAPKGEKSNWVLHEYRLEGEFSYYKFPNKDEWVVSRIFHKNPAIKQNPFTFPASIIPNENEQCLLEYCYDISPLPPLVENRACSSLIDEGKTIEATTKASSALSINKDGDNYHSNFSVSFEDHDLQHHNTNHLTPQHYNSQVNSIKYDYPSNLNPQVHFQNNDFLIQGENLTGTFADHVITRAFKKAGISSGVEIQCKVEQLSSNQSFASVSNDTGISTDITIETSSRPTDKIYELLDITDPNLDGPKNISNGFDYLWDYQN